MTTTPVKFAARINQRVLPGSTAPDRLFDYIDIGSVGSDGIVSRPAEPVAFAEAPSRARRLAPPGSTVVSTVRTYLRAIAYVDNDLASRSVFSTGFAVLQPRPEFDGRYFHYACRSEPFVEEIVARSVGVSYPAIAPRDLGDLSVPTPLLDVQRRIADFLDDQVACIDEAVRLRREQIEALERRVAVAADVALIHRGWTQPTSLEAEAVQSVPEGWRVARLSQVLRQLTNGYVGPTRDILTDEGVRYIQGMHIKRGAIDFDRRHFFVSEAWHAARPRINLRESDVLIVQTGDIGRVAVVPPDFGEASCHALQIARVHEHVMSGQYLGAFLGSSFGYHSLLSRATGALHPHLEGGIRSVPVVVPPHDVQRAVVDEVNVYCEAAREGQVLMGQQVLLLEERKRSLITAAVTGEFDVTTASGRGI